MSCKICNSKLTENYLHGKYELTRCKNCGVNFNTYFPKNEEITEHYENKYKISIDDIYNDERRRYFRYPENIGLINDIVQFAKAPSSILDIGCDKGYFIDEARRYGFNVFGTELSKTANLYTKKIKLDVREKISDFEQKFDIVTLWHVLEHIPEPVDFLNEIKLKMNRPGYLFIRVPAFDSYWSQLLKDKWDWFQPENHLFHYSMKSLSWLLTEIGFDIEKISYNKPNNIMTKKSYKLSNEVFEHYFDNKLIFKKKFARKVQDLIHTELYVIAKLKYIKE